MVSINQHFLHVVLPILPTSHIENTLKEEIEVTKIMTKYSTSYADCFAVTVCKEKATIITGDPEFKLVEKCVNVDWL